VAADTNGWYVIAGVFDIPNQRFLTRLSPGGVHDSAYAYGPSGPNGSVDALRVTSDNKLLVGGSFTAPRARLARYTGLGTVDGSFSPGNTFSNPVRALAVQSDGKIIAGSSHLVARLTVEGARDPSFDSGSGPNGEVLDIALQSDGKILIGGTFTEVNGTSAAYLARLLPSGAVDGSFAPPGGPDAWVQSIVLQTDGRIVVAGAFTMVNGLPRARIARLTDAGEIDSTFYSEAGTDDAVLAMVRQSNGLLAVGGGFSTVNGAARTGIARIGSTDMKLESLLVQANGVARLTLRGQAALGYLLEASEDFQSWSMVSTGITPVFSFSVQDGSSTSHPLRFYRVQSR